MANTTNFGWETPDDTDLVKDGALAMRTLGNAIDTSLVDLKGGTTGQVLSKNTNTDMDFVWTTPQTGDITEVTAGTGLSGGGTSGAVTLTNTVATTFDAKGDLVVGTGADTFAKLTVGTNDYVLTAASGETTGLKWAAIPSSSGPTFRAYRGVSDQTFSQNTWTKVQFNTENWDTDNCFDPTTNYRFTPTKAGYYQFNQLLWIYSESGTGAGAHALYKNGAVHSITSELQGTSQYRANGGDLIYLNGSTDYVEGYVFSANTSPKLPTPYSQLNYISAVWVRS